MSYLGQSPEFASFPSKLFSGDGSTTDFTLDHAPPNDAALLVFIDGVRQDTNAFSLSGTTLQMSAAPPSGTNNLEVVHLGLSVDVGTPGDNTITSAKIVDGAIVNADINASAAIALSKLASDPSNASNLTSGTVATARLGSGTASSSTFLRGDQTYAAAGGGAWELVASVTATANTSTTIGGDSSPIFSSSHDNYVLIGIMRSNQDAFTPVSIQPILSGSGTTADTTDDVQHAAPMMRSNTALGSTALTWSHQDILTGYNISLNYNPMGTGTGEAHAFQMWFYDPFQNASFNHYQLANATVSSYDSNAYTSVLTYAYKKPTTTAYVGLVISNGATGGVDYLLRLYGIKNS